jgi:hypothetical protein
MLSSNLVHRIYRMFIIFSVLSASLIIHNASAHSEYLDLTKVDDTRLFDFYAGNWRYQTKDKSAHGQVKSLLVVNNSVVNDTTYGYINSTAFIGQSLFSYEKKNEIWHQRWIDSLGNVLKVKITLSEYEGAEGLALIGELEHQGTKMKHIWYNISVDRFETDLLVFNKKTNKYQLVRKMPYIRMSNGTEPNH